MMDAAARRRQRTFSLVELMLVVSVLAVLAGMAIPSMIEMQNKAKRAEVAPNVQGLSDALVAYAAAYDDYPTDYPDPLYQPVWWTSVDRYLVPWPDDPGPDWSALDWAPDGAVRCTYAWQDQTAPERLQTWAVCDVDGDDNGYIYRYYVDNTDLTPLPGGPVEICTATSPCY